MCAQSSREIRGGWLDPVASAHNISGKVHLLKVASRDSGDGVGAGQRDVSPSRWCVSKDDLRQFSQEVKEFWLAGGIPDDAIDRDDLDADEDFSEIGPTIYKVNEHFIKPRTREQDTSWALMVNPEGRPCDIFASHSWAEGVFEFDKKMRRAWPWSAKNLYCCFLSNPQNGNLREVLGNDPLESPFARALAVATYVYVIPNQSRSVYTRLWCVYEAYLAVNLDKMVILPGEGLTCSILYLHFLCGCSFAIGAGIRLVLYFLLGHVFTWFGTLRLHDIELFLTIVCFPLVIYHTPRVFWYFPISASFTLCFLTGWGFASTMATVLHYIPWGPGEYIMDVCVLSLLMPLIALSWASITNLQRALHASRHYEEQNMLDFKSVREATCTDTVDELNIRTAIAGQEDDIDRAIRVLKKTGRYSWMMKFNLERGMKMSTATHGVHHSLFFAYCHFWCEGLLVLFIRPWEATIISTLIASFALFPVIALSDLATFFVEAFAIGGGLLYAFYEIVAFLTIGRSFSWSGTKPNATNDIAYLIVWVTLLIVTIIVPCLAFYLGLYRSLLRGYWSFCHDYDVLPDSLIDWSEFSAMGSSSDRDSLSEVSKDSSWHTTSGSSEDLPAKLSST
mmetsp:Transcript_17519/g.40794  ORF Transcript_17519/g.40794 Transcript_17519/m.40794 type:complete len:620 (+) Transcript_17519:31-1890(+)